MTPRKPIKVIGAILVGLPFLIVLVAIAAQSPDPSVVIRGYALGAGMAASICLGLWLVARG